MRITGEYFPGIPAQRRSNGADTVRIGELCAVLTQDDSGLYAVYVAIVHEGSHESGPRRTSAAEWTAHNGLKLRWREATTYFPAVPESSYRA